MDPEFEWDPRKATDNRRKHQASFEEAATAFADPLSVVIPDPDHSAASDARYILVGRSAGGRLLVVSHAERGTAIRIISARSPTRREREQYEEGQF
jgi:uncharacterized DUF497 family protein